MNFKNIQRRLQSRLSGKESTPVSSGPLERLLHGKGRDLWARGCREGRAELTAVIHGSAWAEGLCAETGQPGSAKPTLFPPRPQCSHSASGFSAMNGPVSKKRTRVHVGKVSLLPPTAVLK